jgi:hypothetical protein
LQPRAERTLSLSLNKSGQSEARKKIFGRGVVVRNSPTIFAPDETERAVLIGITTFFQ